LIYSTVVLESLGLFVYYWLAHRLLHNNWLDDNWLHYWLNYWLHNWLHDWLHDWLLSCKCLLTIWSSNNSHHFWMIGCLYNKSACGHSPVEKLNRLVEVAIRAFEKVKVNFSVSDGL